MAGEKGGWLRTREAAVKSAYREGSRASDNRVIMATTEEAE
jgi:hypothetical protein